MGMVTMKMTKSQLWSLAKAGLRVSLLVLIVLQCSVLTARASKNVYIRWGIDTGGSGWSTSWNGDGGSVSSTGVTVQNEHSTSFGNTATPYFTLTPDTGYVISRVEWKDSDSDGFKDRKSVV